MTLSAYNVEYYVFSDQGFRAAPKSDALLAILGVGHESCRVVYEEGEPGCGRGHFSRLLSAGEWAVIDAEERAADDDVVVSDEDSDDAASECRPGYRSTSNSAPSSSSSEDEGGEKDHGVTSTGDATGSTAVEGSTEVKADSDEVIGADMECSLCVGQGFDNLKGSTLPVDPKSIKLVIILNDKRVRKIYGVLEWFSYCVFIGMGS